jgi:hypothetical protein
MQGKREVIQQSGGHSARTRLNGPRQARPPRGDDAGEDRSRPPRLAAARGEATGKCSGGPARKGGRGGGGGGNPSFVDDESREVRRGGRRWRGVDRVLGGPYGPSPTTEAGVGPTKGAGDDDWGMGLS